MYGITERQYAEMMESQHGLCAICGKPETATRNGVVRGLSVDHDHVTGKVRKLLCSRHNSVLGMVDEDVGILSKMIDYLREHGGQV